MAGLVRQPCDTLEIQIILTVNSNYMIRRSGVLAVGKISRCWLLAYSSRVMIHGRFVFAGQQ